MSVMRLHKIEDSSVLNGWLWIVWSNTLASPSIPRLWQHDRVRASCLTTRSVLNQTKDDVCCACIADAANPCVAITIPENTVCMFARDGSFQD